MKASGVYVFTSPSGGQYVGSAVNIDRRRKQHLRALRRGVHYNVPLQKAFNKYGESNLKFEVLIYCERHDVVAKEQHFIDTLNPLYNIARVAGSMLGTTHTPETKARLRVCMAERRADPAFLAARIAGMNTPRAKAIRTAIVAAQFADPVKRERHRAASVAASTTPQARAKNSAAVKARWNDPAYRQNVLAAREGSARGERNGFSKLSDAAVAEIRAMRGKATQFVLADKFGVSQSLISLVQLGKAWPHV